MNPILGGLLLGGAKSIFDEMRAGRQRGVQAAETRYSPWTGIKARDVEEPNIFGNLLQGGLAGYLMSNNKGLADMLGLGGGAGEAGREVASAGGGDIYSRLANRPGILGAQY